MSHFNTRIKVEIYQWIALYQVYVFLQYLALRIRFFCSEQFRDWKLPIPRCGAETVLLSEPVKHRISQSIIWLLKEKKVILRLALWDFCIKLYYGRADKAGEADLFRLAA